jgi:GT2 family glycosyltransferase
VTVTLVVVTHDSAQDLRALLASVDTHLAPRPPVVVADTGSRDASRDVAADWGAEVLELDRGTGFGAANVAALARVGTPVTALVNPDVQLLDGGLARLAAEAAAGRRALLAPRLLNADGSLQRSAHPRPGTVAALLPALIPPPLLPGPLRRHADPWRADAPRTVGWAIAAVLVAPTVLLRELGPFDPEPHLFFEDLDLGLHAAARGVPTVLRPDVALRHAGGTATRRAFGGEPHEVHARRRREVVGARLGRRALALDDAAQALTFATRAGARAVLRRDRARELAQLRALRAARRAP